MWRVLARPAPRDVRAMAGVAARGVSGSRRVGSAERPVAQAASSASIAGENTNEYLVKVPASLEAGLNAAQSTTRSRLLTLTSVAAAAYLGYFIFPLVGGGTASSAVQMCMSKDIIFRKAGVSRLRTVLRVSRDGAHVKHAVDNGATDILLRLIVEDGGKLVDETRGPSRGMRKRSEKETQNSERTMRRSDERRLNAVEAAEALLELAGVSEEIRDAMGKRDGFVRDVKAASRNVALDATIRAKLTKLADLL